jgi:hypothetical protein
MGRIIETKLGRFRAVIDGTKRSWLWECPYCKTWSKLSDKQWNGEVSVYCEAAVPSYYGENPETDKKPCGYHQTHEFAKELASAIHIQELFGNSENLQAR